MYDEQPRDELKPDLIALERQLRSLTPGPPRIDRDRLMFAAGEAAVLAAASESVQHRRPMYDETGRPLYAANLSWFDRRFWPAATFTMTAATLLLATMLVWQNRQEPIAHQSSPMRTVNGDKNAPRDVIFEQPAELATRNAWRSIPSINSGYLSVRYVALTRGIGELSPEPSSSSSNNNVPPHDDVKPTTPRGLLNDLLPATHPSNSSRS